VPEGIGERRITECVFVEGGALDWFFTKMISKAQFWWFGIFGVLWSNRCSRFVFLWGPFWFLWLPHIIELGFFLDFQCFWASESEIKILHSSNSVLFHWPK